MPSAEDQLARVAGRDLTESEMNCLISNFSSQAQFISQNTVRDSYLHSLFIKIQRMVKTKTKVNLISSFSFDGPIPTTDGQGSTALQYAFRGSQIFCAKTGNPGQIQAEYECGLLIHDNQMCPTVMPVVKLIDIDESRKSLISPFYPLSLANVHVQPSAIVNAALCGLCTIKAFSTKNMCHGDIKPANMMLTAHGRNVVTIDFGSSVPYGESLVATTPLFGLDCPSEGALRYDLTCLATSIVFLRTGKYDTEEFSTIAALKEWLPKSPYGEQTEFQIAALCLDETLGIDDIWKRSLLLNVPANHKDWIVDVEEIWPKSL